LQLDFGTRMVRFELYQARTFGADIMVAHMNVNLLQNHVISFDFWKTLKTALIDPKELAEAQNVKTFKLCFPFRKKDNECDQYILLAVGMQIKGPT
jgi:hypothetical protein